MVAAGWTSGRDAIGREIDLMEAFPHFSSAFLRRACMAKYRVNRDGCVIQSIWGPVLGNGKINEGPVDKVPHRRELYICSLPGATQSLPSICSSQESAAYLSLNSLNQRCWAKKDFLKFRKKNPEYTRVIALHLRWSFSKLFTSSSNILGSSTQVLRSIYFEFACKFQLQ